MTNNEDTIDLGTDFSFEQTVAKHHKATVCFVIE